MKVSGQLADKGLHAFDGESLMRDGVKIQHLWIVAADRENAHVYRKTPKGIERIADIKIGHEHSGSGGAAHHGYDEKSEKRHHHDAAFTQKLAAWLDQAAKENVFDKIILAASPHALGDLRSSLSKNVHDRIMAEVDKDFIKLPEKELEERLAGIILPQ